MRQHDAGQSTQALLAAHTERYRAGLLVTLDALSMLHDLVSSASTTPGVHHMVRVCARVALEMSGKHRGASVHAECCLF